MTPDPITPATSSTPAPEPQPPVTPESILATLESALAELSDLAVLIDTAKAAEEQLLKLFELYKRQTLSPAGINDLSKAVQVLYRLTSIRKTLILTVTSLIERHASPKEAQTAIAQAISQVQNESPLRPAAPNNPANETMADEVPEINEISEIGEINEVDEIGEVDDAEEFSDDDEPINNPSPVCGMAASPVIPDPNTPAPAAQPSTTPNESPVRDGRNLPAPRPDSTPDSDADPNTSSLEFSPHSAFRTPHSFVRGVRVCPWLPGLTEKELTRLLIYIGQLQAWEDRRQLWLRTPRRPPIWHPPAWGGFKLENTRPLQFPTHCFDPNFDPCRPATWSPEMIAAEYRREIPFFPSHDLLGPIPPNPFAVEPPPAETSTDEPQPAQPSSSIDGVPIRADDWEPDAPIEDDWDAEDSWPEGKTWDNYESWDDAPSEPPPIILWPPADDLPAPAASPDPQTTGPPDPG